MNWHQKWLLPSLQRAAPFGEAPQAQEPSLLGLPVLIVWPVHALTLEAKQVLSALALVLPSGCMELLASFPPASEAAAEMVRTCCL